MNLFVKSFLIVAGINSLYYNCDAFDPDRIVFHSGSEETDKISTDRKQYERLKQRFGQGEHLQSEVYTNNNNASKEIPLDLIHKISEIQDLDSFLAEFISNKEDLPVPTLQSRFGDETERSNAVIPKQPGCIPQPTVISLMDAQVDASIFVFPSCTKVDRCGGCCLHRLLECQPTDTGVEFVNFQVTTTQFEGENGKLNYLGKSIISVEKHTKCKCGCKIKEEHCTDFQVYSQSECKCKCKNLDDMQKCQKHKNKLWDSDICTCRCREGQECSTGSFFDLETCECEKEAVFTRRSVENLTKEDIERIRVERKKFKTRPTIQRRSISDDI